VCRCCNDLSEWYLAAEAFRQSSVLRSHDTRNYCLWILTAVSLYTERLVQTVTFLVRIWEVTRFESRLDHLTVGQMSETRYLQALHAKQDRRRNGR
jgi:hypothetical protein